MLRRVGFLTPVSASPSGPLKRTAAAMETAQATKERAIAAVGRTPASSSQPRLTEQGRRGTPSRLSRSSTRQAAARRLSRLGGNGAAATTALIPRGGPGPLGSARTAAGGKLKVRRAVRRTKTAQDTAPRTGLTYLEQQSVKSTTQANYNKALLKFDTFCQENGLSQERLPQLDAALTEFMNAAFLEGEQAFVGNTLLAALCYRRPAWGRPRDIALPRAKRSLQGWRRLSPAASRLPLVWEIVAGMAMLQLQSKQAAGEHLACGMLIATVFYLRPSELLRLKVASVVPPLPAAGPAHQRWTLLMHEFVDE